ncbi:cell division protein FtsQ [Oryzomicrobium terrae]|uniref:Cell division protein FtsQ n=1 Tax=Oryzomicrobium terrae TaxID=1735038 RepID=A0A5C1EBM8_9RHOO|nr:cell division protein FtsQ/DivIB [Oryzomicrobium terrae]QEL65999.1 cell division protein FtsQ [Oryzomicrobium terrae]
MWHKPHLLNVLADLLFAAGAAAILAAAVLAAARLPLFPLRQVVVVERLQAVRSDEVEGALAGAGLLRGNFFNVNLEAVRGALEKLPWVRKAEVRRRWPGKLEVRLEEHQAAARWGSEGGQMVNTFGEVFTTGSPAGAGSEEAEERRVGRLPMLYGPQGSSADVLRRYVDTLAALKSIERRPVELTLSPRLAWHLKLDDGMVVELGREQSKAPVAMRLARFVTFYPTTLAGRTPRPEVVDMRYPNGFALRVMGTGNAGTKPDGKEKK